MNIYQINPYLRDKKIYTWGANKNSYTRFIFDYELIYVEKGNFYLYHDGHEYLCQPGQVIFIRPGIHHRFKGGSEKSVQPYIHFDLFYTEQSHIRSTGYKIIHEIDIEKKILNLISQDYFAGYPFQPFVNFSDKEKFLKIFYEIINLDDSVSPFRKKILLTEIIEMLISDNFPELLNSDTPKEYNVAYLIKDYIDSYQAVNMSLDDFEKEFSYSKFHLEKQFKKLYGENIISYRNKKKMELAKTLLKNNVSISTVAERLDYNSISSFSRAFKIHFGENPSNFRKND